MINKSVGIIGYGNMGSVIAERIKAQVYVFDNDKLKTINLKDTIKAVLNAAILAGKSEVIILAVKPQDLGALLEIIREPAKGTNKIFVSIAAGISTGYIEKSLDNARVIRVMPNIAAKFGSSMTCLSKGRFSSTEDLDLVEELFGDLGETLRVDEKMMNAVTAVSGSGPAYVCYFLEQDSEEFLRNFQAAAEAVGFNAQEASLLTKTTYFGTKEYLKNSKLSCGELIKQVASKGGTTEAALKVLDKGGSLTEAVKAALKRAEELSR